MERRQNPNTAPTIQFDLDVVVAQTTADPATAPSPGTATTLPSLHPFATSAGRPSVSLLQAKPGEYQPHLLLRPQQPHHTPISSSSEVPTLETPAGQPSVGLPGYAAVRDDGGQGILALYHLGLSVIEPSSAAETQQPQQQPQPKPQPQATIPPQEEPALPSRILSSMEYTHAAMATLASPPTVPLVAVVSPELPGAAAALQQQGQVQGQQGHHQNAGGPLAAQPQLLLANHVERQQQMLQQQQNLAATTPAQPQPSQLPLSSAGGLSQQEQQQLLLYQQLIQQQQLSSASPPVPAMTQQPSSNKQPQKPQRQQSPSLPAMPSPQMSGMSASDFKAMSRRNFAPKAKHLQHKKSPSLPFAPAATAPATESKFLITADAIRATGDGSKKRNSPSSSCGNAGQEQTRKGSVEARPSKGLKTNCSATAPSSVPGSPLSAQQSPHSYLLALLQSRGYPTSVHKSADCGYKSASPPTPLQLASYGTAVLRAAQSRDASALSALLNSGLSRNPCNRFSESVLDMSAKRGDAQVFLCQVDAGADVAVADDFGRTPLHHAAWGSNASSARAGREGGGCFFDIVSRILEEDPDMVRVADDRGQAPLEYVRREAEFGRWIEFLEKNKDRFWPDKNEGQQTLSGGKDLEDCMPRPKRRTASACIADPSDALPVEVAKMVADGRLKPENARGGGSEAPTIAQEEQPQGFKFPSMLAAVMGGTSRGSSGNK